MIPDLQTALIVVDVQHDFCPGGRLAVSRGDEVVPIINALAKRFANVVLTQDWHAEGHSSFASTHQKPPFSSVQMPYGAQVLWPDHCTWNSEGAAFHSDLFIPHAQAIIRKGYRPEVDSYSGFLEADRVTHTGLAAYLKERGITRIVSCGLATDFCVGWTAQDGARLGFESFILEEASRAIDLNGSLASARAAWQQVGVKALELNAIG